MAPANVRDRTLGWASGLTKAKMWQEISCRDLGVSGDKAGGDRDHEERLLGGESTGPLPSGLMDSCSVPFTFLLCCNSPEASINFNNGLFPSVPLGEWCPWVWREGGVFLSGADTNQRALRQPPGVGLRQPRKGDGSSLDRKKCKSLKTYTHPISPEVGWGGDPQEYWDSHWTYPCYLNLHAELSFVKVKGDLRKPKGLGKPGHQRGEIGYWDCSWPWHKPTHGEPGELGWGETYADNPVKVLGCERRKDIGSESIGE